LFYEDVHEVTFSFPDSQIRVLKALQHHDHSEEETGDEGEKLNAPCEQLKVKTEKLVIAKDTFFRHFRGFDHLTSELMVSSLEFFIFFHRLEKVRSPRSC